MNRYFHSFLIGVSVLPALLVMSASAYEITADTDLNDLYSNGIVMDGLKSNGAYTTTFTTNDITVGITDGEGTRALSAFLGSQMTFGDAQTTSNILFVGGERGLNVWDSNTLVNVNSSTRIGVTGTDIGALVRDGATLNMSSKDINVTSTNDGSLGMYMFDSTVTLNATDNITIWGDEAIGVDNADLTLSGKDVSVSGGTYAALYVEDGGNASIKASNDTALRSDRSAVVATGDGSVVNIGTNVSGKTITISGAKESAGEDASYASANATDGGIVNLGNGTQDINISSTEDISVWALKAGSHVDIKGKNITITSENGSGVWAQNNTTTSTGQIATVDITGDNINISAERNAVVAMSQGIMNIVGNTTLSGDNVILTRGNAQTHINAAGDKIVKMDGDIAFDYNEDTSKTSIDALVDVTLNGSASYWNGNTVISYDKKPADEKLQVSRATINLQNGARWTATTITDNTADTDGRYYTALNNLNIDNGVVNINDATRGVTVDSAVIADATFNGGILNVGEMTVADGTNTFNNNIAGGVLTVNSGATMNIGTNTVDVDTITLNGDMLATLRDGNAQITADNFDGNGNLKLSFAGAGTYSVFGNAAFRKAGIDVSSSVYDLTWTNNDKDLIVSVKAAEDIAAETGIEENSAKAVIGMNTSTSEKLNDLGVKIQEKLAENTPESVREAEHAAKAVHPETESVHQSVATAVQTAVTNLASARMASPIVGRSGGDVELTSGGVWAQGLFNKSKQNGDFRGYTRGIAVGLDGTFNKYWMVGAGYSYAHSDINGSARDTEIDSNTVFLYGQYKPAEWYINAVANYTWSDFSEEGMALGTPVSADYDVDAFGGTVATGYEFNTGITPELGLRYMHVNADDYKNSMDVKISAKDSDFLTGVLGAKYAFSVVADRYTTFVPQLNAAIKYDMLSDKNIATVVMPGVDSYTLNGERLSRLGGEFGVGLTMKHRSLDFSINYDIDVRKDYTSQTGMLKFRYNF